MTSERTETHGDVIYRQDAIDAISCDITVTGRQNAELVAATIGTFADRIKALPSAEPYTDEEIQKMQDMEQAQLEKAFELGREDAEAIGTVLMQKGEPMSDLISRRAAIDFVDDVPYIKDHPNIGLLWKEWIGQLPSAEPEIIRCQYCKHNTSKPNAGNASCELFYGMSDQYGFCHRAERRENEDLDIS